MSQEQSRSIFVQLCVWAVQLAVALSWLASLGQPAASYLWWASLLAAVLGGAMLLRYASQAYRALLWRRRKSIRPSREVQAERKRMAAALHDGLGSQLVHAMALADSHQDSAMQQLLEQCLLDLRLIVDSMDADDDPLSWRLARYRHRLQTVLEHRGIRLYWDIWDPELQGGEGTLPRGMQAQHIMAILQEAVSNILQHAQARQIWITLTQDGGRAERATGDAVDSARLPACLCIEDDGRGLPSAFVAEACTGSGHVCAGSASAGMGLSNMFRRAREMDATLELKPRQGGGSRVRLCW